MSGTSFYTHSGRVTPQGLVLGAAAALVGAPILGAIYAAAIYYIPFVYLNMILTVLFGLGVGFGVGGAMAFGHVRNTALTVLAGLAAAAVGHYVGWIVWVALVLQDVPDFNAVVLLFPPELVEAVVEIGEVGAWSLRGNDVNGPFLWVIWCIEALLVFGAAGFGAFGAGSANAYCEACARWCTGKDGVLRLTGEVDGAAIAKRLEASDLAALHGPALAAAAANDWHQVDLELCEGCGGTNTLSFSRIQVTHDAKGNEKRSEDVLVARLLVSKDQAAWVQGVAAHLAASQQAPEPQPQAPAAG